MRALATVGLILASQISILNSSLAARVTLAWDASTDPTVVGYNLYYGGASQTYTNIVSSGSSTSVTASNLSSGATYYFAATAINAAGLESTFSSEVVYQVSGAQSTVTIANLAQVYDGTPKSVSVSTSPAGLAVAVTYNGLASAPISAGTYQVIASVTDTNYVGSSTNTLVISKAASSVQLSGLNQIYDGTAKSVSVTTIPSGLTIGMTYEGAVTPPSNAGAYQVVAAVNDPNYSGSASNTLIVTKAVASIQLTGLTQTYDGTPKTVSGTTVPAGLALSMTYNGAATPPSNTGTYQIIATVNDSNYSGSATNMLTIAKAAASIQLTGVTQTYDGTPKTASGTTVPAGLGLSITYNGGTTPPSNAGMYQIIATVSDPNYSGSATNTLTIAKAVASIQLSGLTQTYNGTPKTVSGTTVPTGLALGMTYNGAATPPSNAGVYQVVATVSDLNYTGVTTNSLAISKAAASIVFAGLNQVFDGTAKSVSVSTIPNGLSVSLNYPGMTTLPISAGTYPVIGAINDANYAGSSSNAMVIAKAPATVLLSNLNQTYDGTSKPVTATTLPQGLTILLTYNGQSSAPSKPGNYTVVGTVNDKNYAGSATNTLTISKSKGHTIAATTVLQASSPQARIISLPTPSFSALTLNWAPTSDMITISESSDLVTWMSLTNVSGLSGSLVLPAQPAARFFIGTSVNQAGTNRVPLAIQMR